LFAAGATEHISMIGMRDSAAGSAETAGKPGTYT
jgi:hypothetical protein